MRQQQNQKLKVVFLANTRVDPWTMMIKFTNTFSAFKAMLSSNFDSAIANTAKIILVACTY